MAVAPVQMQMPTSRTRTRGIARTLRAIAAVALAAAVVLVAPTSPARAGTVLGTTGCTSSASTTIVPPVGGGIAGTTADCTIQFGSPDGDTMLYVRQADEAGRTMTRLTRGVPDASFGTSGRLQDDHSNGDDEYQGVAVQQDGKIVVLGVDGTTNTMYVRRYLAGGAPDTSFGVAGERALPGTHKNARGLQLAPDGSIFVVGSGADRIQLVKLTPAGALDPSWNGGTWADDYLGAPLTAVRFATGLAILPDGGVVVSGYTDLSGTMNAMVLRYTAEGHLDPSFGGGDGFQLVTPGRAYDVAVQPDGKILVVGHTNASYDMLAARLLQDGTLDPSFNTTGVKQITVGAGTVDVARSVHATQDGRIVIGGYVDATGGYDAVLVRLDANGALDATFGNPSTPGITQLTKNGTDEKIYEMAAEPMGTGYLFAGSRNDQALLMMRTDANGELDTTFGTKGTLLVDQPSVSSEQLRWAAIGPDNRVAAAGFSTQTNGTGGDLLVLDTSTVADIGGGNDFSAGGNSFGACLSSVGGNAATNATTWAVQAGCPLTVGAWWHGIPTSMNAASKVAYTPAAAVAEGTAALRFGLELDGTEPAGRYVAPIVVDVVSPNLVAPSNSVIPAITPGGTPKVKDELTASTGTWSGTAPITYSYQWQRCTPTCSDIPEATASKYRLGADDQGATVKVVVTATNALGTASATSNPTATVDPAATLSAFYVSGFEHQATALTGGGLLDGNPGTATVAADTTVKRSGNASMRFTSSSTYREWDVNVPAPYPRTAAARAYVNLASFPATETTILEFENDSLAFCEIAVNSSGQLRAWASGTASPVGSITLQRNRWYRIDFTCDMSTSTYRVDWSIDGTSQTAALRGGEFPHDIRIFQLGIDLNATMDIRFDDVIATKSATDYPIGPGRVLGLVPNATGTHSSPGNFEYANTDSWPGTAISNPDTVTPALLADWPVSSGLVRATSTTGALQYRLTGMGTANAVNAVSLLAANYGAGGASNLTVGLDGGGGNSTVINVSSNASLNYNRAVLSNVPVSGTRWTPAAVNNMQVRVSSSDVTTPPRVHALMAEVDITGGPTPQNTAVPTIDGPMAVGGTLTASTGTWTPAGASYTYQWQRCTTPLSCTWTDIAGATASTYALVGADQGNIVRVVVFAYAGGDMASASSASSPSIGAQSASLVAMDGFEAGTISTNGTMYDLVDAAQGTIAAQSDAPRSGNHAVRITNTGGGTGNTALGWAAASTRGIARVTMRLERLPTTAAYRELMEFKSADANDCGVIYDPATSRLRATIGASQQPGPVVTAGRWYSIDLYCNYASPTRTLDWKVDGVTYTQVTNALTSGSLTRFTVGNTGGGTDPYTASYDDVAISTTPADWPLGQLAIDPMLPGQVGTHSTATNFQSTTDGGASFTTMGAETDALPGTSTLFDETPAAYAPGVSGDAVRQTNTTGYLEYRMGGSPRTVAPLAVRGIGVHSSPSAAATQVATLSATVGGAPAVLYSGDPSTPNDSLWTWSGIMNTMPGVGGAWTTSGIDALRLRVGATSVGGSTAQHPWTHAFLAEAAYPIGNAPDSTKAPEVQTPFASVKSGDELTAVAGTWSSTTPTTRSWQWLRCAANGEACTPIAGATGDRYTVTDPADVGGTIRVEERQRNESGAQSARSSATGLVATPPTFEAFTGFETGTTSVASLDGRFTWQNSPPNFTTGTVRSGGAAFGATNAATNDTMRYVPPAGKRVTVARAYVRKNGLPGGGNTSLLGITTNRAPATSCDIDMTPGGTLTMEIYDGTGYDQKAGPAIVDNQWYLLELRLVSSGSTWTCDWSVDGQWLGTSTTTFASGADHTYVQLGNPSFSTSIQAWVDDLAVSHTSTDFPIGPGTTVALRPDGGGEHGLPTFFTSSAGAIGATSHTLLSDAAPWTSTATWVGQPTANQSLFLDWRLQDPAERSAPARAVRGVTAFSNSAGANDGATKVLRMDDTDASAQTVHSGNMAFASLQWAGAMVPPPSAGWTTEQLDALNVRTGYSSIVAPNPRWQAVGVEVEYRR